jgi:hypothetical protein
MFFSLLQGKIIDLRKGERSRAPTYAPSKQATHLPSSAKDGPLALARPPTYIPSKNATTV